MKKLIVKELMMTKEEYLNCMDNFKNIWTAMYDVGDKYLKDKYGKRVL
ncbi:hypothetical protein [Campylobacter sp. RM12637]|nr:hypothetical protein [Campylobacter sp. RM12637]